MGHPPTRLLLEWPAVAEQEAEAVGGLPSTVRLVLDEIAEGDVCDLGLDLLEALRGGIEWVAGRDNFDSHTRARISSLAGFAGRWWDGDVEWCDLAEGVEGRLDITLVAYDDDAELRLIDVFVGDARDVGGGDLFDP